MAKIVTFAIFLNYAEPEFFCLESKKHFIGSGFIYWRGKVTKKGLERFKMSARGHSMILGS